MFPTDYNVFQALDTPNYPLICRQKVTGFIRF